jgi:hypothetical protein
MMVVTSEWNSCLHGCGRTSGFVQCPDINRKLLKDIAFCNVTPYSLANDYQGSGGSCCFRVDELFSCPEDGVGTSLKHQY